MRRAAVVLVLAALMTVAGAGAAFAGEWNRGNFNAPGGDLPAKYNARSECVFNGQDEPDATEGVVFPDDEQWSSTPAGSHNKAGIRVQSNGQLVAAGYIPGGIPGQACNGHLNPINTGD